MWLIPRFEINNVAPLERFVADHPTVPRAFASTSTPASYARETYNGVNAFFVFVDAAGRRHPFRFRLAPVAGEAHLSAEDAARQVPDFLIDELRAEWLKARCASASSRSSPSPATPRPIRRRPGRTTASWSTWASSRLANSTIRIAFLPRARQRRQAFPG